MSRKNWWQEAISWTPRTGVTECGRETPRRACLQTQRFGCLCPRRPLRNVGCSSPGRAAVPSSAPAWH